jgi:hypothetical protein
MSLRSRFARFAAIAVMAAGCSDDGLGRSGDACGRDLAGCASELYCDYIDDACGGAAVTGVCKAPPPGACTLELEPVRGCDGEDYENPCAAYEAGTDVNRPEVRAAGGST